MSENKKSELVDEHVSWYNLELVKDSDNKEMENLHDIKDEINDLINKIRNDILVVKEELKDVLQTNKELKTEIVGLRHLNKELRNEITEIRGLNEREKNLYVRSGVPFRFTPDYNYKNGFHRLFPFGIDKK